ncbi:hypothetical protein AQI88_36230 [Streptomyces cellostaticus]|uniref:Uncharacterized protein n=1 Tax=Streptomyces cellostaticus TaxID=67285 RepID=A0A101NEL1_9ACTN|nr:hypothetical protein [Streptomyces cellostaticus]KUM91547.1 hypothetical protein AQI88_36230 [Streptomyces cellostaticus]GHI06247.1 hypothetical protein Scel_45680 [Streptomyces cellostaticus]
MSRRTLKPTRAQIAALLTAPLLGLGLLAPSASADTPPGQQTDTTLIGKICQATSEDTEDGGSGLSCDRDIAPLLSRFVDPGLRMTCVSQPQGSEYCRPAK